MNLASSKGHTWIGGSVGEKHRAVCVWGSGRVVAIDVEKIKGRRTWGRNSLRNTDLVKIDITFGRDITFFPSLYPVQK